MRKLICKSLTVALLTLTLSGCAAMAQNHCEGIYCHDVEPVSGCEHIDDLVVICKEDRIAYYNSIAGWFAAMADAIVTLGIKVFS